MIISVPFEKVRRIIHLADIHIRLFKRHQEYREVFDTLYKDICATDITDTIIVVAGDVVHAKTDLSPEMIDVAFDFLGHLSAIAPTFVILGNHDLNVSNQHRLDALTPIIQNIRTPNLHLLDASGVYRIADVDLAVCSILGSQADWPKRADCSSRTAVALFHGPLHTAATDVGYTITNRHVNVEMFDGFDMVLLGDIHKHQILQQYSEEEIEVDENEIEKYLKEGWELV